MICDMCSYKIYIFTSLKYVHESDPQLQFCIFRDAATRGKGSMLQDGIARLLWPFSQLQ